MPEKGQANQALLRQLAKEWRVATRDLTLASGETDRHKQLLLAGDAAALETEMTAWLARLNEKKRVP